MFDKKSINGQENERGCDINKERKVFITLDNEAKIVEDNLQLRTNSELSLQINENNNGVWKCKICGNKLRLKLCQAQVKFS